MQVSPINYNNYNTSSNKPSFNGNILTRNYMGHMISIDVDKIVRIENKELKPVQDVLGNNKLRQVFNEIVVHIEQPIGRVKQHIATSQEKFAEALKIAKALPKHEEITLDADKLLSSHVNPKSDFLMDQFNEDIRNVSSLTKKLEAKLSENEFSLNSKEHAQVEQIDSSKFDEALEESGLEALWKKNYPNSYIKAEQVNG